MSEIERLIALQDKVNQRLAAMTPEERGAYALRSLRDMAEVEPGLRYLFPDDEFEGEA